MPRKDHFDQFEEHTLVKHFLLGAYLKRWATILLPTPERRGFPRVWFVDAFAGAGGDLQGNPGSPLIAAHIAVDVNKIRFPQGITDRTGMRVLAFEWEHKYFVRLEKHMQPYTKARPWIAQIRECSLESKLDKVAEYLSGEPALFFLDPFGVEGLSASVIDQVLLGNHNELLILFHDEGFVRLAGKARAGDIDTRALIASAEAVSRQAQSLFGKEDDERRAHEAHAAARRVAAGHKSNPNAERICDIAFGGDFWRAIIDAAPEDQRQSVGVKLYEERVLRQRGAKYVLRFSIDTQGGRHKYFLLHASKSASSHAAMKHAIQRTLNEGNGKVSEGSLEGELASTTDVKKVAERVAAHFSGRSYVRWTGDKGPTPDTVQGYAIDETELWLHERDVLKRELIDRGYVLLNEKTGRAQSPLAYNFAAVPR